MKLNELIEKMYCASVKIIVNDAQQEIFKGKTSLLKTLLLDKTNFSKEYEIITIFGGEEENLNIYVKEI